jgi:hypothetical protein
MRYFSYLVLKIKNWNVKESDTRMLCFVLILHILSTSLINKTLSKKCQFSSKNYDRISNGLNQVVKDLNPLRKWSRVSTHESCVRENSVQKDRSNSHLILF